jgi:hypothetical protein
MPQSSVLTSISFYCRVCSCVCYSAPTFHTFFFIHHTYIRLTLAAVHVAGRSLQKVNQIDRQLPISGRSPATTNFDCTAAAAAAAASQADCTASNGRERKRMPSKMTAPGIRRLTQDCSSIATSLHGNRRRPICIRVLHYLRSTFCGFQDSSKIHEARLCRLLLICGLRMY